MKGKHVLERRGEAVMKQALGQVGGRREGEAWPVKQVRWRLHK